MAARTSSGESSVFSPPGGNWPRMCAMTHGLSRPYSAICCCAHVRSTRREHCGSSGSPLMRMTCHVDALAHSSYRRPFRLVGLPEARMTPNSLSASDSTCSARRPMAGCISPTSSRKTATYGLWRPERAAPCASGSADFG